MPREGSWLPLQYELRLKVYASLAALALVMTMGIAFLAVLVSFSWPETAVGSPTARIYAGSVDEFDVAQPVQFTEGKFWLVKQEGGSFIALYWKASAYRGCTVPWRKDFSFPDPRTGHDTRGWFRDPCSGSTWDVNGVRVFGPAPRNMDQFPIEIVGDKIYVRATLDKIILGESPKPTP